MRRVDTSQATTPQSSKSNATKPHWTTYRVSRIPDFYSAETFHDALRASLQLEQRITLTVHSFASDGSHQRTSTITFSDNPALLDSHDKAEWKVGLIRPSSTHTDMVFIDTHFIGFTPLSPLANEEEHMIE
jgi:hypothetical protein